MQWVMNLLFGQSLAGKSAIVMYECRIGFFRYAIVTCVADDKTNTGIYRVNLWGRFRTVQADIEGWGYSMDANINNYQESGRAPLPQEWLVYECDGQVCLLGRIDCVYIM